MKTKGFESIIQQKPDKLKHMSDEEYLKYYIGVGVCNSLNAEKILYNYFANNHSMTFNSVHYSNMARLLDHSQELITIMEDRIEELENELEEWKRL